MSLSETKTPDLFTLIRTLPVPGQLIYAKVWGSHSHNTHTEKSDVDYFVVYANTPQEILSLSPPKDTWDHKKPDVQAHEIRKFARLLIKGNPGVIETLFTDRLEYATKEWEELRKIRMSFLSRKVIKQYLGYAEGQMKRLLSHSSLHTKGGEYNEKWAYHMIRLMFDCERIAKGGVPKVWKEGREHDLLMSIRNGELSVEEVVAIVKNQIERVEDRKPWPLPDEGDAAALTYWMFDVWGLPQPIVTFDSLSSINSGRFQDGARIRLIKDDFADLADDDAPQYHLKPPKEEP